MPDIVTLGEALVDFVSTCVGARLSDSPGFFGAAGGAPANVAVGLARLGVSSGFIGMVGDDDFGRYLARVLEQNGVDVACLRLTDRAKTTLALVSVKEDGQRDFMFYRDPGADQLLQPEDIDLHYIESARILHFGSIGMIAEPSRAATCTALRVAAAARLLVSFDPNVRLALWPNAAEARTRILEGLVWARLVKISREELEFLTGSSDLKQGVTMLTGGRDDLVSIVTLGREGCFYHLGGRSGLVPGFDVEAVDTTGAGDAFVSGLLAQLFRITGGRTNLEDLDPTLLRECLVFANAAGALATTRPGAIPALPTESEIRSLMASQGGPKTYAC